MALTGLHTIVKLIFVPGRQGIRRAFLDQDLRLRAPAGASPSRIHAFLRLDCDRDSLPQGMQHLNRRILSWVWRVVVSLHSI
jgi:hypothetical protein